MKRGDTYHGLPCQNCGGTLRYAMSKKCVPCKLRRSKKWQDRKKEDEVWLAKENERKKLWRENNWEKARQATDTWEAANRDRVNKNARDRRSKDPDKYRKKRNKWRRDNPNKVWKYGIKARHGMTEEEYQNLFEKQGGVCAICLQKESTKGRLFVDHDHNTGIIRGLLCNQCNSGLGMYCDSAAILGSAVKYLSTYNYDPGADRYGSCCICLNKEKNGNRLAIDHCHSTGVLRGLLCMMCNTGLGMFKDDIRLLNRAIIYLESAKEYSAD